ncbi:MAG TPA: DUF1189 domain-containing protein [Nitrospirota bacterium]|jgi:hypothetical protein|nr:DUF1189 domain-containing protein [Nitrospirota bacterium]
MKQYGVFHPLLLSFYSNALYRDVAKNWKGVAFSYLLLLLALTWIPVMMQFHYNLSEGISREAPGIVSQIPKITITKGEVSIDAPVPYYIIDPQSGAQLATIDTSGQTTSIDQTKAFILLTKKNLTMRQRHRAETRTYDLSEIKSFTLDRDSVMSWVQAFKKWAALFTYPFAVAGSFVYRIIQVLIYALIGMLFVSILNTTLDYAALVRLSVIAITPVVLLNTLRSLLNAHIPATWLIGFIIAMGYLFIAVKANADAEPARTP